MRKLISGALLAAIGLSQAAIGDTVFYGSVPVIQDDLQKKDFKQDVLNNLDLLMFANSHTSVMLLGGNELKLNPKLTNQDFERRIGELETVANKRQSIYLYDLISALYAAKLNATDPQGVFDANNPYSKKRIEYLQKCFVTNPKSCDVAAYIGKHYMTTKQDALSKTWLEKSSASGNGYGTYLLGTIYAQGSSVTAVDKDKAGQLFDLSIQQNNANNRAALNESVIAAKHKLEADS